MTNTENDQDAQQAGQPGPAPASAPPSTNRTPRWLWVWILPLIGLLLLYMARSILGPFIIAAMLAYIFSMVIDQLQDRLHWPRALIVAALYVVVLGALGTGLYFGAAALIEQTRDLIGGGPQTIEQGLTQIMGGGAISFGGLNLNAHTLASRINEGLSAYFGGGDNGGALHLASVAIGRLLDVLLVLVVCFYLLVGGKDMGGYFLKFVPLGSRARTGYVAGRIHTVLGAYLRGQLLLLGLMSLVSFLILQFGFNLKYALPLGILTGFLEILPLLGPAIAALTAAGIALAEHGAGAAIGVVVVYTILRQLEDQLVMPFVVGRAVELHPVVTIFAVLAGGAMAGVLGMLLAVPATAAIKVILDFVYPTEPEQALAQAQPGLKRAAREAEAKNEEPVPPVPSAEPG